MKASRIALTAAAAAVRPCGAAFVSHRVAAFRSFTSTPQSDVGHRILSHTSRRAMSTTSSGNTRPPPSNIRHISKPAMQEIIADFEQDGRVDSGYCVVDVRRPDEVAYTGKLCPSVPTLPVELIMQANVFELDEEEFEEVCGFSKPSMDETLVFSCAAGIRSVYACQYAAKAGYTNLISYAGGANEWFRS